MLKITKFGSWKVPEAVAWLGKQTLPLEKIYGAKLIRFGQIWLDFGEISLDFGQIWTTANFCANFGEIWAKV